MLTLIPLELGSNIIVLHFLKEIVTKLVGYTLRLTISPSEKLTQKFKIQANLTESKPKFLYIHPIYSITSILYISLYLQLYRYLINLQPDLIFSQLSSK